MDTTSVPVVARNVTVADIHGTNLAREAVDYFRAGNDEAYQSTLELLKVECCHENRLVMRCMEKAGMAEALCDRVLVETDSEKVRSLVEKLRRCYPVDYSRFLDTRHGFMRATLA